MNLLTYLVDSLTHSRGLVRKLFSQGKVKVMCAAAFVCLSASAYGQLYMSGTYSFSRAGSIISLGVQRIDNDYWWTSGTLSIQLWATASPYYSGTIYGYKLCEVSIGTLPGYSYFSNVTRTTSFSEPPPGTYNIVFILAEWSGSQWLIVDSGNFSSWQRFGPLPPEIVSASSAYGQVGTYFTYQISVLNGATAFSASGLPPGLTVNAASGLVYGTPTSSGTYYATVYAANAGGTSSKSVAITVRGQPPSIVTQPQNQARNTGESVSFSVGVISSEAVSYQWRHNNVEIPGATGRELVLSNLTTEDAGTYDVIVYNSGGSRVSSAATLSVTQVVPLGVEVGPGGTLSPNYTSGVMLALGQTYSITAVPGTGYAFDSWEVGTDWANPAVTYSSTVTFTMQANRTVRAKFKDGLSPSVTLGIAKNYQLYSTSRIRVMGTASDNLGVALVKCRVNEDNWVVAEGTTSWAAEVELKYGTNTISAFATDAAGNASPIKSYKVVYNPFLNGTGTYNGLFASGAWQHGNAGAVRVTVTSKGSYSGYLVVGGRTNRVSGLFNPDGSLVRTITRTGANPLLVTLNLNLTSGGDQLVGTVSDGFWQSDLRADKAIWNSLTNPAPFAGKYTLVFPGSEPEDTGFPTGCGYGTVVVDAAGKVAVRGYLADGTVFSQTTTVAADGRWPFYASLYGTKGSAWGWLGFTNAAPAGLVGGQVLWSKPTLATKFYPMGFQREMAVEGSRYVAPSASTPRVLNLTSAVMSFTGGNLGEAFTNQVALSPLNTVLNGSANALTCKFSLAGGSFLGTVTIPGTKVVRAFKGVVLQNANYGYGYFLGTNASGRVYFGPPPS